MFTISMATAMRIDYPRLATRSGCSIHVDDVGVLERNHLLEAGVIRLSLRALAAALNRKVVRGYQTQR